MPISDLFGLLQKRQTTPDKFLASSVNVVAGGQQGALRAPFSQDRGVRAYRSWVYAAATINANAVASLPLRLYAKRDQSLLPTRAIERRRKAYLMGDGQRDQRPSSSVMRKAAMYGDDFEEVVGPHPVLDLLGEANPFLNGFDLAVLRVLYGELTGNAYLHPIIDEATGLPSEIWPLASHFVEVIPDEDQFIRGYLYGQNSQMKQVFETDEVIHFKRPNPGNLFYGLGKVEAAYGSIVANDAVHEMDISTFANSARPDYAVVVKGTPSGDQLDRFQQQVENRLKGARKDGSFITVTGDVQFTPLNFPPKDLAGREEIVEEIAAVFGVPVSMLKANDPNLASATSGFAQWREGTILPLCRMDEQELNQSLLPLFGLEETHCLAYDNPVPSDQAFELQERQTAVAGGWRTPNEARLEEGREPIVNEFAEQLLVGGQPLGGAAQAAPGLLSMDQPEPKELNDAAGPDLGFASSLLESVRERRLTGYAVVKLLQAAGFTRAIAEKMVEAEEKAGPKKKVLTMYRQPGDLYETPEEAEAVAVVLGCSGHHVHEVDGRTLYMPCEAMEDYTDATGLEHGGEDDLDLEDAKALDDVDLKPTAGMAKLAARGLALREEHGRGGTEVGVARARDISNRANLSPETVGRMANFFSRHRVDLDAPAAKPGHDEYPSAGVVAWLLWGGDPANPDEAGAAWADRKLDELEAAREKAEEGKKALWLDWTEPGCCSKSQGAKVYEWPDETKWFRLAIEGLAADYDRLRPKAATDEPDADDDIRSGERRTPAMSIAVVVQEGLESVRKRIIRGLESGEIGPEGQKSAGEALESDHHRRIVRAVLADLVGARGKMLDDLTEAITSAARSGGSVGTARVNEILGVAGAERISTPALSAALEKAISGRASLIVASVIDATVTDAIGSLEGDFSIAKEVERLQTGYGFSVDRAETIARTESANAYHEGQVDTWKEAGVVKGKHFLVAPGACEFCKTIEKRFGAAGKSLEVDAPMVRGGETIQGADGGTFRPKFDSQGIVHPNCRCDFMPVLEDL
jgi:HK97 family phage portal protein